MRTNLLLDPRLKSNAGHSNSDDGNVDNLITTDVGYAESTTTVKVTPRAANTYWSTTLLASINTTTTYGIQSLSADSTKSYLVSCMVWRPVGTPDPGQVMLKVDSYINVVLGKIFSTIPEGVWTQVYAWVPAGTPSSNGVLLPYLGAVYGDPAHNAAGAYLHVAGATFEEVDPADITADNISKYPPFNGSTANTSSKQYSWSSTVDGSTSAQTDVTLAPTNNLQSRLGELITSIGRDYKKIAGLINGTAVIDLSGLKTQAKGNLVDAINEVNCPRWSVSIAMNANPAFQYDTGGWYISNAYGFNAQGANSGGQRVVYTADVSAGVWRFDFVGVTNSNAGILDLEYSFDGTNWFSLIMNTDFYSTNFGPLLSSATVTLPQGGRCLFRVSTHTDKNASSTNWYMILTSLAGQRLS